jgi:signal transduction histidine kinase
VYILAVVVVALTCGAGPSLTATLVGTVLLYYSVLAPQWSWRLAHVADGVAVVLLVVVGVTMSLLAGQTEQTRREAVAATAVRDQFLSVASHELRTPLTTIKATGQLAHRRAVRAAEAARALNPDHAADLEALVTMMDRVDVAVGRQNRLVDELLDVSRIQAGKLELYFEPCDLRSIVRDAAEEQRIQQPGRVIEVDVPPTPMLVQADEEHIGQVVTNYLTNALKYSEADHPVLVTLAVEGEHARMSVQDHGPGLAPEQPVRVWELYHRVPGMEVRSGTGVGLGLGLYLCRSIVLAHPGGQVGLESIVGDGSTFWFTVPLVSRHD